MSHIKLKPSQVIPINLDFHQAINKIEIPQESKQHAKRNVESNELSDSSNQDLILIFDNALIYGFDYLHENRKVAFIEMDPTTIFYSNVVMSYGMLEHYKTKLLSNTYEIKNTGGNFNPNHFGDFFNLAINCIINLQASLESFINFTIAENYIFLDKKSKPRNSTIHEKMEKAITTVSGKNFENHNSDENKLILDLIELRNNIVHIKPDKALTKTKFKVHYRKVLDFQFQKTMDAVKNYINYYSPNLIEECSCGKLYVFDFIEKK